MYGEADSDMLSHERRIAILCYQERVPCPWGPHPIPGSGTPQMRLNPPGTCVQGGQKAVLLRLVNPDEGYTNATKDSSVLRLHKDLRVAEVTRLDVRLTEGGITSYRTRLNVSFKYQAS